MQKGFIILTIFLLLIPSFVLAEVSTDALINVVKQETSKVKQELVIKLDTKFNELDNALMDSMKESEGRINDNIDNKLNFMLLKWTTGLFFSFLLALLFYHYIRTKQERHNPFYAKYKDKEAQMKTMVKLEDSKKDTEQSKIVGINTNQRFANEVEKEKEKQDKIKEKLLPPKEPPKKQDVIKDKIDNSKELKNG